jgi:hypothetical protein
MLGGKPGAQGSDKAKLAQLRRGAVQRMLKQRQNIGLQSQEISQER